jgi:hypothetical protein
MELAEPTIAQGLRRGRGGAGRHGSPYMLAPGRHATLDIRPRRGGAAHQVSLGV